MSEDVQIFIEGERLTHFSRLSMSASLDIVGDQFSFTSPFYPDEAKYRQLFRPFSYQDVRIDVGGERRFTGRMETPRPAMQGRQNVVTVQGRSRPGVLVDCTFERAGFPVQYSQAGLDEITNDVLRDYDFNAVFDSEVGAIFEETGPTSASQTVFAFLETLARQRRFLMSQTTDGDLWFRRAAISGPISGALIDGQQGVVVSAPTYDGSTRYSSLDMFGQEAGVNDKFARVEDPALAGIHRPRSAQANDTNAGNIVDAATWALTLSIAKSMDIPVEVVGWRREDGDLWAENTLITLHAPSIMVYKPSPFLIKRVVFYKDDSEERAALSLTIPELYSGSLPGAYPWDV